MKTPKQPALQNLEEWSNASGVERKVSTIAYNIPYGMAKGIADKARNTPHAFGTYWKIIPNIPKKKEVEVKQAA